MTKTYQIVDLTNGGFEIVASNLTWADASNQAMTLSFNLDGRFREVSMGIDTLADYRAYQNGGRNNQCEVQRSWAYL